MTTYTGTTQAFLTGPYKNLELLAGSTDPIDIITYGGLHMIGYEGWVHIGEAEIVVTVHNEAKINQGIIDSIDAQIKTTYAEAESKINLLKEKKQQLLAITLDTKELP